MQEPPRLGYLPYEPPKPSGARPAVITWYRVYAALSLVTYVGILVVSTAAMIVGARSGGGVGLAEQVLVIVVLGVVALLFGGLYGVATFVPYKPWGWVVGLVAICLGLSSCLAPLAIPLLIYWMKPETKAAFGRL